MAWNKGGGGGFRKVLISRSDEIRDVLEMMAREMKNEIEEERRGKEQERELA
jgi:hypothetical protein